VSEARAVVIPRPAPLPWWKRFFLVELMEGMSVTLKHYIRGWREPFTVQYPEERLPLDPRFRGYPRLRMHPETGDELCNVCRQCEKICPTLCIAIEEEPHPSGKGRRPKQFTVDYERCCQCGLCAEACGSDPISAIYMSHDYELADYGRDRFRAQKDRLYFGFPAAAAPGKGKPSGQ
jgi:NADH-quinone oxidoreductase subunit I